MPHYQRYCFFFSGVLLFRILHGVRDVLADTEKVLRVGGSLDLSFPYPTQSVLSVHWSFNNKIFAEYSTDLNYTLLKSQFSGRIKKDYDRVGVTVQDLQPQDSGTFSVSSVDTKKQHPSQILEVYIQNPITAVQIEKNQTWKVSTNSCDVDVRCAALGAERVSYLWSGYKNVSGAQLQFSLSPAEGAVTVTCTAANNISSNSTTETLRCRTEPEPKTKYKTGSLFSVLKLISSAVAASPFMVVTIILSVKCYRARGHRDSQYAMTVIEE